jgi:DNA topoisomerase-1
VSKGSESRSLTSEEQLLTIGLEEALAVLAQPKQFRGRGGAPKPPLREFGNDPVSGRPIVAKEGRFGTYVTDGETNASLGRGDRLEEMTPERAQELLAIRREVVAEKGPAPAKRSPAKKAAGAKKAAAPRAAAPTTKGGAKKAAAKRAPGTKATGAKKAAAKKAT